MVLTHLQERAFWAELHLMIQRALATRLNVGTSTLTEAVTLEERPLHVQIAVDAQTWIAIGDASGPIGFDVANQDGETGDRWEGKTRPEDGTTRVFAELWPHLQALLLKVETRTCAACGCYIVGEPKRGTEGEPYHDARGCWHPMTAEKSGNGWSDKFPESFRLAMASAIKYRHHDEIRKLVDSARSVGCTYSDIAGLACEVGNVDTAEWDSILYELDSEEGGERG